MILTNNIFETEYVQAINRLMDIQIDIKDAYKLVKFIKQLSEDNKVYLQMKTKLFEKYWEDIEWWQKKIKEENMEEFKKEFFELLSIKNEYTFEKIKKENINISVKDLLLLEDLFE